MESDFFYSSTFIVMLSFFKQVGDFLELMGFLCLLVGSVFFCFNFHSYVKFFFINFHSYVKFFENLLNRWMSDFFVGIPTKSLVSDFFVGRMI